MAFSCATNVTAVSTKMRQRTCTDGKSIKETDTTGTEFWVR